MQITAREDIEAPIEAVFAEASDFPAFERQALRRGADVRRVDGEGEIGEGTAWEIRFQFRGREREVRADIVQFEPPQAYAVTSSTGGLEGLTYVECVALARSRTRITMVTEFSARTLPARLLLQSLKLARGKLTKRLTARTAHFAREVEARWQRRGA
ncbi:SRPBCC family protein [Wenxinia saemankumensis]|uniref:Polyketide cyclase / dehydrase and lipid transport n=1 Tax=Wenxinia saemankumensis TaxID=1447782 RepID=A0A1M6DV60_9RHOB|nr:SRPBCC family protein [Wenxinia saemankumensis]SHI77102.1 Polyketide cyclase / dehydrase and lipid transport [Wenxinia saemankumensis]